jgi:hypothetical protein
MHRVAEKQLVRRLLIPTIACLLVSCAFSAHAQSARADSKGTPQATLMAFYHWYLQEMAKNRDPLTDDRSKLEEYASKALVQEVALLRKSSDVGEDYFIRAQDEPEDWASHIVVTDVQIHGTIASAIVTLGATKESRHRLALKLIKEAGSWKISKVSEP